MNITMEQMTTKVNKRVVQLEHDVNECQKGSFSERGKMHRLSVASQLLARLNRGDKPSTSEVVAYFGKGTRME